MVKNIGIVIPDIHWAFDKRGGGSVVVRNFIFELTKMEDVHLTIFAFSTDITIPNANVICVRPEDGQNVFDILNEATKKENCDLVFSFTLNDLYGITFLQAHSFLYRVQNTAFALRWLKRFFSDKKIKKQSNYFEAIKSDTKFVAVSNIIKNDYAKNYNIPSNNIIVAYPACEKKYNNFINIKKRDKITFGIVANNSLNKGGHLCVFALGLLNLLGYKFNLKIISEKLSHEFLLNLFINIFNMKKNIEFISECSNLQNFYDEIDCLIVPSFFEAFGLVVIEAMESGKNVIVSNSAGICEILNEKSSFIFNRNSFNSFLNILKKVIKLYNEDFEQFNLHAKNAYELSKNYTWKDFTLNIINQLIN